jgi:hypothetical protein
MARLTADRANQVLSYSPETGELRWKVTLSNVNVAGNIAGGISKAERRISISVDREKLRAHSVIWLMMTGKWPTEIDHINGDATDNRWANLREVSHRENMRNRKVCTNNKSGIMGVCWNKHAQKWRARVKVLDKQYEIGSFIDFFEACCARKSAELTRGFHENHGRIVQ